MTNNPDKVIALERYGISVAERVPHVFPSNGHNERYLRTKATRSGHFLPAEIKVWSAGVKAADFLKDLDGLETNRINQLVVLETLQTTRDGDVFAIGERCSVGEIICSSLEDRVVVPKAKIAARPIVISCRLVGRVT